MLWPQEQNGATVWLSLGHSVAVLAAHTVVVSEVQSAAQYGSARGTEWAPVWRCLRLREGRSAALHSGHAPDADA